MFLHITKRTKEGVFVSGAKAHQTGCINSHYLMVMPTMRLGEKDKDYAIVGALPVTAKGITYVYGRQSCDTRSMEEGSIDVGNATYGGKKPWSYLIMFLFLMRPFLWKGKQPLRGYW